MGYTTNFILSLHLTSIFAMLYKIGSRLIVLKYTNVCSERS